MRRERGGRGGSPLIPTLLLAAALVALATRRGLSGVFHWAGAEPVSRWDLGVKIAAHLGFSEKWLQPVVRADTPEISARRPRALALKPRLLLLDEPLAGLNSKEARSLADTIAEINRQGVTIVLIEHNLGEVMRICQRLVVLDNGRKIADGEPRAVMDDPLVRAAYLGGDAVAAPAPQGVEGAVHA